MPFRFSALRVFPRHLFSSPYACAALPPGQCVVSGIHLFCGQPPWPVCGFHRWPAAGPVRRHKPCRHRAGRRPLQKSDRENKQKKPPHVAKRLFLTQNCVKSFALRPPFSRLLSLLPYPAQATALLFSPIYTLSSCLPFTAGFICAACRCLLFIVFALPPLAKLFFLLRLQAHPQPLPCASSYFENKKCPLVREHRFTFYHGAQSFAQIHSGPFAPQFSLSPLRFGILCPALGVF